MKRLLLPLAMLLAACAPPQERTTFELGLVPKLPSGPNQHGWTITLDEARLRVGPVRFFEGKVLLSRTRDRLWIPFVGVAHAHPGHYVPGEALAEWLDTKAIDLLAGSIRLGRADGFTGDYGSLKLELPTSGEEPSVLLRGTATKDEDVRPFEVRLDRELVLEGVRAEAQLDTAPTTARLELDLSVWLGRVDFATTVEEDGLFLLAPSTQAHNAFTRGVADTGAWTVVFAPTEVSP